MSVPTAFHTHSIPQTHQGDVRSCAAVLSSTRSGQQGPLLCRWFLARRKTWDNKTNPLTWKRFKPKHYRNLPTLTQSNGEREILLFSTNESKNPVRLDLKLKLYILQRSWMGLKCE